jgi:hypothetical protein
MLPVWSGDMSKLNKVYPFPYSAKVTVGAKFFEWVTPKDFSKLWYASTHFFLLKSM